VVLDNTVALRGNNFMRGNVYKTPRVAMAETPCMAMAKTPHVAMAKTPRVAMSWRGNLFFHAWQWPVPRACFALATRKILWCHAKNATHVKLLMSSTVCENVNSLSTKCYMPQGTINSGTCSQ